MTTISIRVSDDLLEEANRYARALHVPRTEYIRQAIAEMNKSMAREARRRRMFEVSRRVREDSLAVNREFASFEGDPDAHSG